MLRLTHRRCRHEAEDLAGAARRQAERADHLAAKVKDLALKLEHRGDDLAAAEHRLDEITAACADVEYARTDAVIPGILREKLLNADNRQSLLDEHSRALARIDALTEQQERTLRAARAAGMFARVYALMAGAGPVGVPDGMVELLSQMNTINWANSPWACECGSRNVVLVWHPAARHRARLTCRCQRIWTDRGAVGRGEAAFAAQQMFDGVGAPARPWSSRPAHELAAADQAMPSDLEMADAAAVPA
ncbi:hypothetical protein [Nocardiopsis tropica]|uniref:Uncharacterized protein n=1 Tax=Nocardiopsis tropica TaxID=109330 RepID=A0ABU7L2E1_9ACTN|nr:hypothetical protein [Nocardiopsis umidischolae]MEE2055708.1 hypothetical protein [Nocardiopsis umidischolae]